LDRPLVENELDTLLDVLPNNDEPTDHDVTFHQSLRRDIQRVFDTLTMREREILILYFGIGLPHGLTLEEIAAKLEITRERVRQIKEKVIKKMKK
jgi:RNA polymerase primary sigma factor